MLMHAQKYVTLLREKTNQWSGALKSEADPVTVNFDSLNINEPQRIDFLVWNFLFHDHPFIDLSRKVSSYAAFQRCFKSFICCSKRTSCNFFLSWMWVFVAYEYFEQAYIEQQRQDDEYINFFIRGLLASSYNTISHIQANKKCVLQIIANKYAV